MTHEVENAFREWMNAIGLGQLKEDSIEFKERRRTFFSGAFFMYTQCMQVGTLTEDEACSMLEAIDNEMQNFLAGLDIGVL